MKTPFYNCPIEATMEVIGGKWKAIILFYLTDSPRRFNELMQLLETVSARILTRQLQELERDGMIARQVYPQSPPRVEYRLTEYGATLQPLIQLICQWGENRLEKTGKKAVWN